MLQVEQEQQVLKWNFYNLKCNLKVYLKSFRSIRWVMKGRASNKNHTKLHPFRWYSMQRFFIQSQYLWNPLHKLITITFTFHSRTIEFVSEVNVLLIHAIQIHAKIMQLVLLRIIKIKCIFAIVRKDLKVKI